jgi:Zn-dependent protease
VFLDNQPTPFDLRFRMFRFPVRVHPLFWLSMALLGSHYFQAGFDFGLIWVACGFVSILVHELGHAFMIRRYRSPALIELYAFGGLAIPTYVPSSPWRRLAIALAGPAAGFVLLGLVIASDAVFHWHVLSPDQVLNRQMLYAPMTYEMLYFINLYWTILNLLPIWPFDGGKALREVMVIFRRRQPDRIALWVSVATAGMLAVLGVLFNLGRPSEWFVDSIPSWLPVPGVIGTFFFFLLALQSYMLLRQLSPRPRLYAPDDEDRLPWERRRA